MSLSGDALDAWLANADDGADAGADDGPAGAFGAAPVPDPESDPVPDPEPAPEPAPVQFVVFAVGELLFALPGAQVSEILPLTTIYPVPGCPPAAEGVIDVRGRICSVLRVGDLLDCPHGAVTRHGAILLGVAAGMESGLRVDAVLDVCELPTAAVHEAPAQLPERLAGLASGLFDWRARAVLLLDLERIFAAWLDGRL